jgi:hypothetical protein
MLVQQFRKLKIKADLGKYGNELTYDLGYHPC